MAATSADVPGRFDVVINGTGYLFYDQIDESLPFRTAKAIYSYSPTFVERSNVQGNYGDQEQDFWLTASQNDWSLGEQQRYFKAQDPDGQRKYWRGTQVDVSIPGQVSMRYGETSTTSAFGSGVLTSMVALPAAAGAGRVDTFYGTTSTNLWNANTDKGAHGLGASPTTIVADGTDLYMSTETGGTVGVRKFDLGASTFSTFSATAVSRLAFLNNTLYGLKVTSAAVELGRFDTAGVYSTIFTWKAADGGALGGFGSGQPCPYGGKLAILLAGGDGPELWAYDGVGTSLLAKFPANLVGCGTAQTTTNVSMQLQVAEGILFISGGIVVQQEVGASTKAKWKPAIWYYVNGNIGELWRASNAVTGATNGVAPDAPLMAPFQDGLAFVDDDSGLIRFYSPATGGISSIATPDNTTHNNSRFLGNMRTKLVYVTGSAYGVVPDSTAGIASEADVNSSLFDFDSSLNKIFRGIKVDFDNGGSGNRIDIAYRLNDVDGSYTTLQTTAVSGAEYTLSGVTGRSISVQAALHHGGAAADGPILKRVSVRAVPILQQFPMRQYILACFGDATTETQTLRDGSVNPKSGRDLANDLITAVTSQTPISITDRFGTYTAILEPANFELHEIHANPLFPATSSGSFVARVSARGV